MFENLDAKIREVMNASDDAVDGESRYNEIFDDLIEEKTPAVDDEGQANHNSNSPKGD